MKKAFISVYTLLVLLIVSLSITFIYNQQKSSSDYARSLYDKKKAQYLAESILNSFMDEKSDRIGRLIIDDYDKKFTDNKTRLVDELFYKYEGKTYKITISKVYHPHRKELNGLYMIFPEKIKVGESTAMAEIYVKVFDRKDEINEKYDKNRLRIKIRHTY